MDDRVRRGQRELDERAREARTGKRAAPPQCDEGIAAEDFYSILPQAKYLYTPTRSSCHS